MQFSRAEIVSCIVERVDDSRRIYTRNVRFILREVLLSFYAVYAIIH